MKTLNLDVRFLAAGNVDVGGKPLTIFCQRNKPQAGTDNRQTGSQSTGAQRSKQQRRLRSSTSHQAKESPSLRAA
jgi:hypothetical protein